jgi:hypothetical protein
MGRHGGLPARRPSNASSQLPPPATKMFSPRVQRRPPRLELALCRSNLAADPAEASAAISLRGPSSMEGEKEKERETRGLVGTGELWCGAPTDRSG